MPWLPFRNPHAPAPGRATLQDVFGAVRVALNHAGGIVNTLSAIALTQARQDARLESIAHDIAGLRSMMGPAPEEADAGG